MSGLLAIRALNGVLKPDVEILRGLAYDGQTSNFAAGNTITGIGAFATGVLTATGNPTGAVKASGTLTGTTIAADDVVTVDDGVVDVTYTFVASLSSGPTVANEVLVGAADTDSLDNLIAAMNGGAGVGTLYSVGTVPLSAARAQPGASDTLVLVANVPGTAGNAIATTATLTSGDWAAAVLENGAAGDTVLVDDETYTFSAAPLYDEPNYVLVGGTASASLDNLIDAINGEDGAGEEGTVYGTGTTQPAVTAAAGAGDTIDFTADTVGDVGEVATVCTPTTDIDFGAATLEGGVDASGASGVLVEQTDGGATGELILRDVVGEFADNERISNGASGDGLANGVLYCPLLTPSDSLILQADGVDMERGEALQMIKHLATHIRLMPWHADNGLSALRLARGGQAADVVRLGAVAYDGQSNNFTVGHLITGGTSGATGTLVEQTDGGATGTLVLSDIVGAFENNDALTDEGSGDGDATGAQTCPLLTPDDELILQMDGVDMTKSDALELLRQIESVVHRMEWPYLAAA